MRTSIRKILLLKQDQRKNLETLVIRFAEYRQKLLKVSALRGETLISLDSGLQKVSQLKKQNKSPPLSFGPLDQVAQALNKSNAETTNAKKKLNF